MLGLHLFAESREEVEGLRIRLEDHEPRRVGSREKVRDPLLDRGAIDLVQLTLVLRDRDVVLTYVLLDRARHQEVVEVTHKDGFFA